MSGGTNEFIRRSITGALYVVLTVGAALAGPWTTFMLFLPVCVIGAREWHRLSMSGELEGDGPERSMLLAGVSFAVFAAVPLLPGWGWPQATATVLALLLLLLFLLMRGGSRDPAIRFAVYLCTVIYIALPFATVTWMVARHWHVFVGFMFLLWSSDTGAYLVGRAIGRTKLMPAVSPGKTWEGLVGGVILTMGVGWGLSRTWLELTPAQWMAGAAVVAVTATLGDLLESAFKRARGVKDSGTVLPGHGGILDRFDGFLLAAPAMVLALLLSR